MQRWGKITLAAGCAALAMAGTLFGAATARAQDEAEGTLLIKKADGSVMIRKPALTLEGRGEIALKPQNYGLALTPFGPFEATAWQARLAEIRAFLINQGVAPDTIGTTSVSGGLSALFLRFTTPAAAREAVAKMAKYNQAVNVQISAFTNNEDEKKLQTLALEKAIADADARKNLFAKAALPRQLVLSSMQEGEFQVNSAQMYITLNKPDMPLPNMDNVFGPNARAYATMTATLRYGWKDEMGDGNSVVPGAIRAIAPVKPAAKPAPKKTAAKQ